MSLQEPTRERPSMRPGSTGYPRARLRLARRRPRYLTRPEQIAELGAEDLAAARRVGERFVFRANDYYLGLIDWSDPDDPLRRIVVPDPAELEPWGRLDASNEGKYTVAPGLEHKYADTALLLVNDVCGAYCRFCFRKRLFMDDNDEVVRDVSPGLAYIAKHPEIDNVLLTGGDPLIMSTRKLAGIIERLRGIDHVQIIRIGTKMPAFDPFRILEDPDLLAMIRKFSSHRRRIYVMAHFNHPRELTEPACEALGLLHEAGAVTVNQTPLLKGVNDDPEVLHELFDRLSYIGVPPYYVFQGRPTEGNKPFTLPVERAFAIFEEARRRSSGLAKRARFAMSHESGKIELLAVTGGRVVFRYHRAANPQDEGRVLVYPSNPAAYWFDDYQEPIADSATESSGC